MRRYAFDIILALLMLLILSVVFNNSAIENAPIRISDEKRPC